MGSTAGAICLVANELAPAGQEGAIGNYFGALAELLAGAGWRVHVLDCGPAQGAEEAAAAGDRVARAGVSWSRLADLPVPPALRVAESLDIPCLVRSDRVSCALEELHRRQRFDLVEFAERGGIGFRPLQAQRGGLAIGEAGVIVRLHGSTQWLREHGCQWMGHFTDLRLDFGERYSFEQARFQVSSSSPLLDYHRAAGWSVRQDAAIVPAPLADAGVLQVEEEAVNQRVLEFYLRCLEEVRTGGGGRQGGQAAARRDGDCPPAPPLVTVVVPYHNLGPYLPETLASLAGQSYPNMEVLVIDDGSMDPAALQAFEEQRRLYPDFRFLRQANAGLGATRNRGLAEARGKYFVPVDADNIATHRMIERFVVAMERNPGVAAMTSFFFSFQETQDIARGEFLCAARPTGGPHVMASFWNVYGDANAILRTADLRAVGGYETDRDTTCEDWELYVKLVNAGHEVDVIPDYLFYYRYRESSMLRTTNAYRNHQRVLRQYYRLKGLSAADQRGLWVMLVSLKNDVEHLWRETYRLHGELGAVRDQNHRLAGEAELLRDDGERLRQEGERLQHQTGRLEEDNERLRQAEAQLQDQSRRLREETERLHQHNGRLEEDGERLRQEVGRLRTELGQLRHRLADKINRRLKTLPFAHQLCKAMFVRARKTWVKLRTPVRG
jgi:glycosyltransferase involved in cell wall biosynthesis